MEMYLKIAAGLLLLVRACHSASLQYSTNSPRRTIDKSYLRELDKNSAGSQNAVGEETEYDQLADETALGSSEHNGGAASDSSLENPEEENNVTDTDKGTSEGPDDLTTVTPSEAPVPPNVTNMQPEFPDATMSPTISTTNPANTNQTNTEDTEEKVSQPTTAAQDSTSQQNTQNTTSFLDDDHTDSNTSTSAPEVKATQQFNTTPGVDAWSTNATGSTNTTPGTTTSSSTTVLLLATTELTPATTATLNTPEMANVSDEGSAKGGDSERGFESDSDGTTKTRSWGAVLGTAVAVACVGIVVYIILKKQQKKDFSHRKLVEEFRSDPVLRLDNGEPLDFSLGGSAYYNPGLQGDNIQMSNLPGRH